MKKEIYNSIYRLFEEGDYGLTITAGPLTMKLYDARKEETPTVWENGVVVNDQIYQVGDLYNEGQGPGNYAELFTGEYDIIEGLADVIYKDFFEEED